MGLSNYLPSSRISQSGVCTSTTRPASPFEGQVIYETDTDRVLVWNASAWVAPNSQTANPPGLELVKTQTIGAGVASVTVTDAFSADYDAYKIVITGGTGSANRHFRFRLGAVTSGYQWVFVYTSYDSTVLAVASSTGTAIEYTGQSTTSSLAANIEVQNPFLTEHTFVQSATATPTDAGTTSGTLPTTTSYTDFTVFVGTGTITGGTIRVYGYRN